MKKFWLQGLALMLGVTGASSAMAQYPGSQFAGHPQSGGFYGGPNNLGATAFPVVPQVQNSVQSLPRIPQGFNAQQPSSYGVIGPNQGQYQLISGQDMHAGAALGQATPQMHAPAQPQITYPDQQHYPTQNMVVPAPHAPHAAQAGVPLQQDCQTCPTGGAPVANMDYDYAQSVAPNCTSCGPAPIAQSYGYAPSNFVQGPVHVGGGYFGGGHFGGQHGGHLSGLGGLPTGAKPWFGGGGVLFFNRIDNTNKSLSFADSGYAPDVLGTQDARMGVMPGFEVMLGRYFNCGRNAIAVSYWGIFSDDEMRTVTGMPGDYRSRIPFTYLDINSPGTGTVYDPVGTPTTYGVYDWFDQAQAHRITRSSEYHNLEVNLLGFAVGGAARNFNLPTAGTLFSGTRGHHGGGGGCGYCGGAGCGACGGGSCSTGCNTCGPSKFATGPCCLTAPACGSRCNVTWLAGVRYFRFEDNLTYAASLNDTMITRAADDLYYDVNTTNDLIGFQLGSRLDYCVSKRINLYGNAKAGIFGNRSVLTSRIGTDFQTAYLNDPRTPTNPNSGGYMFDDAKTDVAFMSELGTGLGFRVSPKWTTTVGYRAVVASGVATAPDNVEGHFANYADIRDFDNRGTLILHGINIGALYNF